MNLPTAKNNGTPRSSRKRKRDSSDDEEADLDLNIEKIKDDDDHGKVMLGSGIESPIRRMPTRKSRVAVFKPEDGESDRSRAGSEGLDGVGNLQGGVEQGCCILVYANLLSGVICSMK